jgi:hypothetical protein
MNATEIILWSMQGFLAAFFLAAGAPKLIGRGLERWTGFSELPGPLVVFIGGTEILGALGLVLPTATGILPWLTPLAAVGLAITVLMAAGFHLRANENLAALETVLWAGLASVVAIGRWDLIVPGAEVPGWTLVLAIGVLLPAAIVNVVVLWRSNSMAADSQAGPVSTHHITSS